MLPSVGHWYELLDRAVRVNDTSLLLGTNSDEGRLLVPPGATPARFEAQVRARFGSYADAILALYPHATEAGARRRCAVGADPELLGQLREDR